MIHDRSVVDVWFTCGRCSADVPSKMLLTFLDQAWWYRGFLLKLIVWKCHQGICSKRGRMYPKRDFGKLIRRANLLQRIIKRNNLVSRIVGSCVKVVGIRGCPIINYRSTTMSCGRYTRNPASPRHPLRPRHRLPQCGNPTAVTASPTDPCQTESIPTSSKSL